MNTVDCIIDINDTWMSTKKVFSIFFTINIDPFKFSNKPIRFKGFNEYGGFNVIGSLDEKHRRIVHWFYRNIDTPSINDWNECIDRFNIPIVPIHILQLYDKNKDPLNKFILIHAITNEFIHYTYENREDDVSITVTVPIGIASLIPERYLFNLNMYSRHRNQ
jgi:hypothetical protein